MSKALGLLLFFVSFVSVVACDDPVKPPEDDGRVKAILSGGCRAGNAATLKGYQSKTPMIVKSLERTYDWFVPDTHDGRKPLPLVFVYHGSGGTGAEVRTQFKLEDAVAGQAIMVYPDAIDSGKQWDLERPAETNADMVFFDQIKEKISNEYCVDTNRTFVAGVSNGAFFANQLGCLRGGSIRAIVAHSGGGPESVFYSGSGRLQCPQKPVAAMIIHGADDQEVLLEKGKQSLDHWTNVNGCRTGGLEVFEPAPCRSQLSCADDRPVVYCEVPNIGHTIWSESPRAAWSFFNQL